MITVGNIESLPLCKCGCGNPVLLPHHVWLLGHWFNGKKLPPRTEEVKKKISESQKGKKLSEEHLRKIRENHAHGGWNKPTKTCPKCGDEKPYTAEFFHKSSQCPSGLYPVCKQCRRPLGVRHITPEMVQRKRAIRQGVDNEYYFSHKVEIDDERVKWRRWDIERKRKSRLAREAANPEKHKEQLRLKNERQSKKYRENPQKYIDYQTQIRKSNPVKARAKARVFQSRRKAHIYNAAGNHTASDVERQYEAQNCCCWWCGKILNGKYDTDHVIPISRGGSNNPDNLVAACSRCNKSKSDRLPSEWTPSFPLYSEVELASIKMRVGQWVELFPSAPTKRPHRFRRESLRAAL